MTAEQYRSIHFGTIVPIDELPYDLILVGEKPGYIPVGKVYFRNGLYHVHKVGKHTGFGNHYVFKSMNTDCLKDIHIV